MIEIKRMLDEFYNRSIIQDPMVIMVMPEVHVYNIWAIPDPIEKLVEERRKIKKRSTRVVQKRII